MKALTLCADDFAQSPAISNAILRLLEGKRIAATSVMSQSPLWPALADELAEQAQHADIGLHFNLTHPFRAEARPLAYWLLRSQVRQLPRRHLVDCWLRQIDLFSEQFQRLPDFIDGHQHVHALPVIRDALFEALRRRWGEAPGPYLRAPDQLSDAGDSWPKAAVLRAVTRGFARQANARGFDTPSWFAGLYSLTPEANYPALMQGWLATCRENSLIMCHPGLDSRDDEDPIGPARALEYRYLASPAFSEDCQRNGVRIQRLAQTARPSSSARHATRA